MRRACHIFLQKISRHGEDDHQQNGQRLWVGHAARDLDPFSCCFLVPYACRVSPRHMRRAHARACAHQRHHILPRSPQKRIPCAGKKLTRKRFAAIEYCEFVQNHRPGHNLHGEGLTCATVCQWCRIRPLSSYPAKLRPTAAPVFVCMGGYQNPVEAGQPGGHALAIGIGRVTHDEETSLMPRTDSIETDGCCHYHAHRVCDTAKNIAPTLLRRRFTDA